ncbi:MAG: phosphoribosylanthranilate isomerase [Eubacteriaceae bacterium]|jgi:phosphoribosylanthranilate isomerase
MKQKPRNENAPADGGVEQGLRQQAENCQENSSENNRRKRRTRIQTAALLAEKNRPLIKICGLSRAEDVEAVNSGADIAGFVFAESRRRVTPEQAALLAQQLYDDVLAAGVFVNADADEIIRTVTAAGLDLVQLHGNESNELIRVLQQAGIYVIRAFRMPQPAGLINDSAADLVLLDSGVPGSGTGFSWEQITTKREFLLAGGLNTVNLEEAENYFTDPDCRKENRSDKNKPAGYDLSSGAETDGLKDPIKIQEIIKIGNTFKYQRKHA